MPFGGRAIRVRHERARQRPARRADATRRAARGATPRIHRRDDSEDRAARRTPTSTARPPAIASASATPTCSCEIEKDSARYGEEVVFGGGKVIRDGQGQSQATRASGAPDLVITNAIVIDHWGIVKADVGVRDGRICADRQGRQPGHPGRRHAGPRDRRVDRDHRRRTSHPHRRRHRLAHPFHQPAAGLGSALQRRHDDDRRRHRAGRRHARDDLHAGRMEHPPDARGGRRPAAELRLPRQGQRVAAGAARRADPAPARSASSCTRTGARRRPRSTPRSDGRRRVRRAGRDPHRHAERVRLRRRHARGVQGADDPHLPQRGRRRRPRARHHEGLRRAERASRRARIRRCRTR